MIKKIKERLKELRIRLVLVYTGILSAFLICALLFIMMESYQQYKKEEKQNIEYIADSVMMQLDNYVNHMNFILVDTISNQNFIAILREIRKEGISDKMKTYYRLSDIRNCITTQSSTRMLYRLSVMTENGFFASSKVDTMGSFAIEMNQISWMDEARAKKGGMIILGPHKDPWGTEYQEVISVIRQIRNPVVELGFLEAQLEYEKIVNICEMARQSHITVIDENQNLIFSNRETEEQWKADLTCLVAQNTEEVRRNPVTKKKELVSVSESELSGLTCIVSKEISILDTGVRVIWTIGILVMLLAAAVSSMIIYLFIQKLMKPLMELKSVLETTDLETLSANENMEISHSDINEINSLIRSFRRMNLRLEESLIRERNAYQMQMDARFDALQAQINPHFMHNMLNVIVNMAYEENVQEIPEVCNRLSENIRYSTSTKEQITTLRNELRFVENYLILMKKRFEHKLEYSFSLSNGFDDRILLPKLTLIPFVENAVCHPYFESEEKVIRLYIETGGDEKSWYFKVQDNGNGFGPGQVEKLQEKMEEYLEKIKQINMAGLEIGGLGIVNTYARLNLFFHGEVQIEMMNAKSGGAVVIIRGWDTNVQNHDC